MLISKHSYAIPVVSMRILYYREVQTNNRFSRITLIRQMIFSTGGKMVATCTLCRGGKFIVSGFVPNN